MYQLPQRELPASFAHIHRIHSTFSVLSQISQLLLTTYYNYKYIISYGFIQYYISSKVLQERQFKIDVIFGQKRHIYTHYICCIYDQPEICCRWLIGDDNITQMFSSGACRLPRQCAAHTRVLLHTSGTSTDTLKVLWWLYYRFISLAEQR